MITNTAVHIYSNPTQDFLTIKNESELNLESIRIVDLLGKTIYTTPIEGSGNTYNIGVEKLSSGTYFLEINTNAGKIISAFVKQ